MKELVLIDEWRAHLMDAPEVLFLIRDREDLQVVIGAKVGPGPSRLAPFADYAVRVRSKRPIPKYEDMAA